MGVDNHPTVDMGDEYFEADAHSLIRDMLECRRAYGEHESTADEGVVILDADDDALKQAEVVLGALKSQVTGERRTRGLQQGRP